MRPTRTIYDIGGNRLGQRLTLEEHQDSSVKGWRLVQHADSQRDETQTIYVSDQIAAAILDKMP